MSDDCNGPFPIETDLCEVAAGDLCDVTPPKITTYRGCLFMGGELLSAFEGDCEARKRGFVYAEQLVGDLEKRGEITPEEEVEKWRSSRRG